MFISVGGCQIEDKDEVFVIPNNKYAPKMIHQPEMYNFIHSTHEKPSSRLKTQ